MTHRYADGSTDADRIAARLRNSGVGGGTNPTAHVQTGSGPQRVHHNLHQPSGQAHDTPRGEVPQGRDILRDFGKDSKGGGR
jgi:hypothetical protein